MNSVKKEFKRLKAEVKEKLKKDSNISMTGIFLDPEKEAVNNKATYKWVAFQMGRCNNCLIGWTDGRGMHFDILFSYLPAIDFENRRVFQGGIKLDDIFVSVMRRGAFAFNLAKTDTHASYYEEKLNVGRCPEIADLINGVKKAMSNQ